METDGSGGGGTVGWGCRDAFNKALGPKAVRTPLIKVNILIYVI